MARLTYPVRRRQDEHNHDGNSDHRPSRRFAGHRERRPDQSDRDDDGLGDACDPCTDEDEDGYGAPASPGCPQPELDCDDRKDYVNPDQSETPGNGRDDDCNAATPDCPDADGDGYTPIHSSLCPNDDDCDDTRPTVHPDAPEIPFTGIDEDCNPGTPGCQVGNAASSRSARGIDGAGPEGFFATAIALVACHLLVTRRRSADRGRSDPRHQQRC